MEPDTITAAAARAAAAPPMPWRLLADVAAAGVLTSLEVNAPQVQYLLAGSPTAAAAAPAAAAAAAPAAPSAAAAAAPAVPGLAATLAGLRCLEVAAIEEEAPQLQQVGRLLGSCGSLTKLVLRAASNVGDSTPLLNGMLEAAAAAAAGSAPSEACPGGSTVAAPGVPLLQHLELVGPMAGLLDRFTSSPGLPHLTRLKLASGASHGVDLACLAACSGLQELELQRHGQQDEPAPVLPLVLPDQLTQLRGLTKLVLDCCVMDGEVPPEVWQLTQLRHLSLQSCCGVGNVRIPEIPDEISSLRHLTHLSLDSMLVEEVPADLGTCLPQLQHLGVNASGLDLHEAGITQFGRLTTLYGGLVSLASQQQLGGLKELCLHHVPLSPPFTGVSRLTALERLALHMEEGSAVVTPTPLPRLRDLDLTASDPVRVAGQLVGSGQHLTFLLLGTTAGSQQQGVSGIHQLGVLPKLNHLELTALPASSLVGLGVWLSQQPQLAFMHLGALPEEVMGHLSSFPPGSIGIVLPRCSQDHPNAALHDPALAALTGLEELQVVASQLPSELSSLVHLQALSAYGPQTGWEVLGQLPLLRRLAADPGGTVAACLHAPHLCWTGTPPMAP